MSEIKFSKSKLSQIKDSVFSEMHRGVKYFGEEGAQMTNFVVMIKGKDSFGADNETSISVSANDPSEAKTRAMEIAKSRGMTGISVAKVEVSNAEDLSTDHPKTEPVNTDPEALANQVPNSEVSTDLGDSKEGEKALLENLDKSLDTVSKAGMPY